MTENNYKKIVLNIIIGLMIIVVGVEAIKTLFLQPEPNTPQSEYIEIYPETFYFKKDSLKRIGNNIYYETKLIITDKLKSQYPENTGYLIENHEFNCETGHYSRRDLKVFDKENKPVIITQEQIKKETDIETDDIDYANNMTLCAMSENP